MSINLISGSTNNESPTKDLGAVRGPIWPLALGRGMSIRFFKVQQVDASTGQMRLKVWVRMTWPLGFEGTSITSHQCVCCLFFCFCDNVAVLNGVAGVKQDLHIYDIL